MASILAAYHHSAAVSRDGHLYTWGSCGEPETSGRMCFPETDRFNDVGGGDGGNGATAGGGVDLDSKRVNLLGHGDDYDEADVPKLVKGPLSKKRVVGVSGGAYITAAVTTDGQLFTWGGGGNGALGHKERMNLNAPTLVCGALRGKFVVTVSASGDAHAAALTRDGELYTWGQGRFLQLGHGNDDNRFQPALVGGLLSLTSRGKKVIDVSTNSDYSAAVTSEGHLFTWGGGNLTGRLGHGNPVPRPVPTQVQKLQGIKVTAVSLGREHAAAVSESGKLYVWGSGRHGKLGLGNELEQYWPVNVKGVLKGKKILTVSAGIDHTAAVTVDNKLYTWGWGADGRLGHGNEESKAVPTHVERLKDSGCALVSAGHNHTAMISPEGELLTWGGELKSGVKLGLGLSFGSAFIRMDPSLVKMPSEFEGWCTDPASITEAAEKDAVKQSAENRKNWKVTLDAVGTDSEIGDEANADQNQEQTEHFGYNMCTNTVNWMREFRHVSAKTPIPVKTLHIPDKGTGLPSASEMTVSDKTEVGFVNSPDKNDQHVDAAEECEMLMQIFTRFSSGTLSDDIQLVPDEDLDKMMQLLTTFRENARLAAQHVASEMKHRTVADTLVKEHPNFACPLSGSLMRDPVVAADGHSYERRSIENHLASSTLSPIDGDRLQSATLVNNRNLKREISEAISKLIGSDLTTSDDLRNSALGSGSGMVRSADGHPSSNDSKEWSEKNDAKRARLMKK